MGGIGSRPSALSAILDRPAQNSPHIHCPLLVCACDNDLVTPAAQAARVADRAPNGALKRYPIGHFDAYTDPHFEHVVRDQIEFLNRALHQVTRQVKPLVAGGGTVNDARSGGR